MLDDPSDIDAEAVRRLRTSVEFANLDVNAKVIMVTSAVSEEGKTTTIANLAIALARAGSRVALVDLDLRKPTIGRLFGLELRPGLADVAIERVALDTALFNAPLRADGPVRLSSRTTSGRAGQELRSITGGQLYVLPAGFIPASPGELVGTTAVAGILASLREQMDFVLVDAPPMLTVSDAATVSRRADAIVIVARLGVVNRPMLRDLARALDATPARKLGFILTGAGATESYDLGAYGYQTKRSSSEDVPRATAATDAPPEMGDDEDWPAYGERRTTL
jgi:non-specific protein-tyrosine kinase